MSDIQKARDVLAKWRANAMVGGVVRTDLRLIVGTASKPDLLDAIDDCLYLAEQAIKRSVGNRSAVVTVAERVAAAIIAADERMSA